MCHRKGNGKCCGSREKGELDEVWKRKSIIGGGGGGRREGGRDEKGGKRRRKEMREE